MTHVRLAIKNTGDMSSGFDQGDSPVTIFTVTGDVLILEIFAIVAIPVAGPGSGPRFRLGIAGGGAQQQLYADETQADDNDLGTNGDVWLDDGTARDPLSAIPVDVLGFVANEGDNVLLRISNNNTNAGEMNFYARWKPLSTDGDLVAA